MAPAMPSPSTYLKRLNVSRNVLSGLFYLGCIMWMNCKTLKERRDELCLKTLNKIAIGGPLSRHIPSTIERMLMGII